MALLCISINCRGPLYVPSSDPSLRIAQRTRAHFTPQHWLLCHVGLYWPEFEFGTNADEGKPIVI